MLAELPSHKTKFPITIPLDPFSKRTGSTIDWTTGKVKTKKKAMNNSSIH